MKFNRSFIPNKIFQELTGFWDEPYEIDGDNIDHYPIVPEFPSIIVTPLFMIATLLTFIVLRRKHPM